MRAYRLLRILEFFAGGYMSSVAGQENRINEAGKALPGFFKLNLAQTDANGRFLRCALFVVAW